MIAVIFEFLKKVFRSIGGYISSRVYDSLGGSKRKKNTFVTATALPTWVHHIYNIIMIYIASCRLIFAVVFLLNFFLLSAGSSGAVPFGKSDIYGNPSLSDGIYLGTMLLIILMWFGISAPLSAVGSYFGSKRGVM